MPLCHFDDVVPGFDDVPTEFACFFFEVVEVGAAFEEFVRSGRGNFDFDSFGEKVSFFGTVVDDIFCAFCFLDVAVVSAEIEVFVGENGNLFGKSDERMKVDSAILVNFFGN